MVHRRAAEACAGGGGFCGAIDQFLQAAGARIRGAGEFGILAAKPLRSGANTHVFEQPEGKALEFRPPDPSCNPYLAYSAMLMAGLDGIENKIDPGGPLDKDIFELSKEELSHVPSVPGSLEESLKSLGKRSRIPHKGGRVHEGVHRPWIDYKMSKGSESDANAAAPVRIPALLRYLSFCCLLFNKGASDTRSAFRFSAHREIFFGSVSSSHLRRHPAARLSDVEAAYSHFLRYRAQCSQTRKHIV